MLNTKKGRELAFILAAIVYMAVLYISTFELYPVSRKMPLAVLGVLTLVIIIKLLTYKFDWLKQLIDSGGVMDSLAGSPKGEKQEKEASSEVNKEITKRVKMFILWLAILLALSYLIGFLWALAIWLLGILVTTSKTKPGLACAITVGTMGLIYLVFVKTLSVRFMQGILF